MPPDPTPLSWADPIPRVAVVGVYIGPGLIRSFVPDNDNRTPAGRT